MPKQDVDKTSEAPPDVCSVVRHDAGLDATARKKEEVQITFNVDVKYKKTSTQRKKTAMVINDDLMGQNTTKGKCRHTVHTQGNRCMRSEWE